MNKIDAQLKKIALQKRMGLMMHVVVGYPTLKDTASIVKTMAKSGVDFVELQIPFADPLADGPTIQHACEKSLENGTRVKDSFEIAAKLSSEVEIPLLFMGYFNTVFKYGVDKFCADAKAAGISGLIIPDAPLEAAKHEGLIKACQRHQLHNIITVSPATTEERLGLNAHIASGFVYCMAQQGITGSTAGLDPTISSYIERVKKIIKLPVAVGFGISQKQHLEAIESFAEVGVIGSALIRVIAKAKPASVNDEVEKFIRALK